MDKKGNSFVEEDYKASFIFKDCACEDINEEIEISIDCLDPKIHFSELEQVEHRFSGACFVCVFGASTTVGSVVVMDADPRQCL